MLPWGGVEIKKGIIDIFGGELVASIGLWGPQRYWQLSITSKGGIWPVGARGIGGEIKQIRWGR